MKELSRVSYDQKIEKEISGWDYYKQSPKYSNSLKYKIYRKAKGKKFDYTIAINGTKNPKDFWADYELVLLSKYKSQIKQLEKDIISLYKKDKTKINNLYITGHSLGGFLTSYVVSDIVQGLRITNIPKSKVKGYTFNAPGFWKGKRETIKIPPFGNTHTMFVPNEINIKKIEHKNKFNNYIINYYIEGDLVSKFGTRLGSSKKIKVKKMNLYEKHLIKSFTSQNLK